MSRIIVAADPARRFAALLDEALAANALVALSGGSTVRALLGALAHGLPPGGAVAQVDERLVPPGSPEANWTHLRAALGGTGATLLPMVPPELLSPEDADTLLHERTDRLPALAERLAAGYATTMERYPRWGLAHLGLGPDGHTASLFPGSPALADARLVAPNVDPSGRNRHWRLTLTATALRRFEHQVVVALGIEKAAIVARALSGEDLPINRVLHSNALWLLDEGAARGLDQARLEREG